MIRVIASVATALSVALVATDALAVDLPPVAGEDVTLDVTETSILSQRFNARSGERPEDQGYFAWLNRLNGTLSWRQFTLGLRVDTSLFALRPEDRTYSDPQQAQNIRIDGASRYQNSVDLAKLFLTYKTSDVEVTLGDNYAQFGRGLILSMRKVDELGLDTTLLGAKVSATKSIFGATLIAGIANPSRLDEPTGRSLSLPKDIGDSRGPQPLFGNDRIVGASVTVGRTTPVVLSTNAVFLSRCAPYRYDDATGRIIDGTFDRPIGTCDDDAVGRFLGTFPQNPALDNRHIANASQTLEIPSLWGHGNLYIEGAVQKRDLVDPREGGAEGNAVYGALSNSGGPVTNLLEVKSNRNFYPLAGSIASTRSGAFANIAYSAPPTTEPVIADTMFNNFNVCVTGAHDRLDYRLTSSLLVYATAGYWYSLSEQPSGQCDAKGRNTATLDKATSSDRVVDASVGTEWRFDQDRSYVFMNFNARDDLKGDGNAYYRELAFQHTISKHIKGPYSIELAGRHRYRVQDGENLRTLGVVPGAHDQGDPWTQGEEYLALKIAPKWIWTVGYEYTTQIGFPTDYFNGGVVYKFTSDSNIRLYAGQNRGGLRCVSGICRVFPSFDGARAELTLRF